MKPIQIVAATTNLSGAEDDDQLVAAWLISQRKTTRKTYETGSRQFRQWVNKPLRQITATDLAQYMEHVIDKYADNTAANKVNIVRSLLTFAHKTGYLAYNVGVVIKPPARERTADRKVLTEEEAQMIINAPDSPNTKGLLMTLYYTGARVSEICNLNYEDVLMSRSGAMRLLISKSKSKTRVIVLPDHVSKFLKSIFSISNTDFQNPKSDFLNSDRKNMDRDFSNSNFSFSDRVFENSENAKQPLFQKQSRRETGLRLTPNGVWQLVRYNARKAGVAPNVSPHWFRHSHITHALMNGAPIDLVQRIAGHESMQTTGNYAHAIHSDSSAFYLIEPEN